MVVLAGSALLAANHPLVAVAVRDRGCPAIDAATDCSSPSTTFVLEAKGMYFDWNGKLPETAIRFSMGVWFMKFIANS